MRGDLFSLVRLILQDRDIFDEVIKGQPNAGQLKKFMDGLSRAQRNNPDQVINACRLLFAPKSNLTAKSLLLGSIKTVKDRTKN